MSRTIAGAVLVACVCPLVHAQSAANAKDPEVKLEFEVASIKRSALPGRGASRLGRQGGPGSGDPGRVSYAFSTIRDLIVDAYGVKPSQVSGGPKWLDSERFDIMAKFPRVPRRNRSRSCCKLSCGAFQARAASPNERAADVRAGGGR